MQPKRVQPKRDDFSSFDDYFHAMIQYHLELSRQHLEDVQSFLAFHPDNLSVSATEDHPVCKSCTNGFECNMKKRSRIYREKACLIFQEQARALKSPHLYNSGKVRLPEERSIWHERLTSFLQEHLQ